MSDTDDETLEKISEYLDGDLPAAEREAVGKKIADDPAWQRAHAELVETRKQLSGLQKARAPSTFAADVTSTIHKRSAGRFFARRTFGDRVPFGALVLVAVLVLAVVGYVMWSSSTGSLKVEHPHHGSAPTGSGELVPTP